MYLWHGVQLKGFPVSRLHRPAMGKPSLIFIRPRLSVQIRVPLVQSLSLPHLAGLACAGPASVCSGPQSALGPRRCWGHLLLWRECTRQGAGRARDTSKREKGTCC